MANEPNPKKTAPARAAADQAPAAGTEAAQTAASASAAPTNPAGAAIAAAVRNAEGDQLTKQRDRLRELVGEAPTVELLRAEVDALQQVAARAGVTRATRWTMSAGVASDLETVGYAVDPTNGDAFVRDGDRVTVTSRAGETRTIEMPTPPPAPGTSSSTDS